MSKFAFIAVAITLTIATAAFLMPIQKRPSFMVSSDEGFCRACEALISNRLLSPSTYKRIECGKAVVTEATEDQFMGWNWPEKKRLDLAISSKNSEVKKNQEYIKSSYSKGVDGFASTSITYDAENGFGSPVRNRVICESVIYGSKSLSNISELSIRINGDTNLEWSLDRLN